jgi:hypothetical protein
LKIASPEINARLSSGDDIGGHDFLENSRFMHNICWDLIHATTCRSYPFPPEMGVATMDGIPIHFPFLFPFYARITSLLKPGGTPMSDKEMRTLLHHLDEEVKNTHTLDQKGIELLQDLDKDIQGLLERSEQGSIELHPSLVKRLESALEHFEVTHPNLTTLISELLDSLSNAGI